VKRRHCGCLRMTRRTRKTIEFLRRLKPFADWLRAIFSRRDVLFGLVAAVWTYAIAHHTEARLAASVEAQQFALRARVCQ